MCWAFWHSHLIVEFVKCAILHLSNGTAQNISFEPGHCKIHSYKVGHDLFGFYGVPTSIPSPVSFPTTSALSFPPSILPPSPAPVSTEGAFFFSVSF